MTESADDSNEDAAPELTLDYIRYVLAEDIRSEAGPGEATGVYNRSFIETFRANAGRMPGDLAHATWMLLTTTGAKSGKQRTVPLIYFERNGGRFIIASKGGALTHPAWFHNLRANPGVTAEFGHETVQATATELESDERDEFYAWAAEQNRTFAKYQARTDRVIPVIRLDPVG
ncbi:MAG: nitroreductase/quinone reductase family protein [Actinomycetota bacterium]